MALILPAFASAQATFTVTNTTGGGPGSLPQAITDSNASPVPPGARNQIVFAIPGTGVQTIALTAVLPTVRVPVSIDGFTQPAAAFGAPLIELDGTLAAGVILTLENVNDCLIRGLVLNRAAQNFPGFVGMGVWVLGASSNNRIQGNFVGTNAAGTAASPNSFHGIQIQGATGNFIGTDGDGVDDALEGNLISGNTFVGVFLIDAVGNRVSGNRIGTNAAGTAAVANGSPGISLGGSSNNLIGSDGNGTSDDQERNVISGGRSRGVQIRGLSSSVGTASLNNVIRGNFIGTDATGALPIPNVAGGVSVGTANAAVETVTGNVIQGNVIAFNGGPGVQIPGTPEDIVSGNRISNNSIFENAGIGIDLGSDGLVTLNDPGDVDTGPNDLLNFPVLDEAVVVGTNLVVSGWSRPGTTVDLFGAAQDSTGFGEGRTFIAGRVEGSADDLDATVTTYGPGAVHGRVQGSDTTNRFRFVILLPPGVVVGTLLTATATDGASNTSEFSGVLPVQAPSSDLSIVKGRRARAAGGVTLVYTTVVTNYGPHDADAVVVTDPTPPGLTFVSNAGDCTTPFPCSLGLLPADPVNGVRTITTTLLVPSSYAGPNPIVNTATVSSASTDPHPDNNSSTAMTPVGSLFTFNVEVSKAAPASATAGTNLIYETLVTNSGTADATGVEVADPPPSGLTLLTNEVDCVTPFPCALGTIPPGESRTIRSTYAVPSGYTTPNPIINVATVTSTSPDDDLSDNTSSTSTALAAPRADLILTKSGPGSVTTGATIALTIGISNAGPSDATAVMVSDSTPAGLTLVSTGGDCATAFPCALGTVPAGATRTIIATYTVTGIPGPPIVNTASVAAATADPVPENNQQTVQMTVSPVLPSRGCDVDGDGFEEIVTGAGPGGGPHVRVISMASGAPADLASFFAYNPAFRGGVFVACADVNGDGFADVITGADRGGGPHVRAFSVAGTGLTELASFYAYDAAFAGGVRVAAADVNGDGLADIITGAGPSGGPHVRVFTLSGGGVSEVASFMAYDPTVTAGVTVAAGDVDGDGLAEVVTGTTQPSGPVRVFSARGGAITELGSFFAYFSQFTGEVRVGAADVNGDGLAEVITGAGTGGGPHVQAFGFGGGVPAVLTSFYAYEPAWCDDDFADPLVCDGVSVGGADVNGDGAAEIITATNEAGGPLRVLQLGAGGVVTEVTTLAPYPGFQGPIRVASLETPTGRILLGGDLFPRRPLAPCPIPTACSAQMSLGERAAGTRLQVTLEFERSCFVAKRDHHVELPRPMSRRVDAFASVMRTQTRPHIVGHARVITVAITEAAQHIYETFL